MLAGCERKSVYHAIVCVEYDGACQDFQQAPSLGEENVSRRLYHHLRAAYRHSQLPVYFGAGVGGVEGPSPLPPPSEMGSSFSENDKPIIFPCCLNHIDIVCPFLKRYQEFQQYIRQREKRATNSYYQNSHDYTKDGCSGSFVIAVLFSK